MAIPVTHDQGVYPEGHSPAPCGFCLESTHYWFIRSTRSTLLDTPVCPCCAKVANASDVPTRAQYDINQSIIRIGKKTV